MATIHLPKVVLTGNKDEDGRQGQQRNLLMSMIAGCVEDDRHVGPLYDVYLKRCSDNATVCIADVHLEKLTSVYAGCYEDLLTAWIISVSDFTAEDLLSMRPRWSKTAYMFLSQLGLQYNIACKLLEECREQKFVLWLFTKRHNVVGLPLAELNN